VTIYALLLCVGLWINRREAKMLALTIIVSAGIFLPIPHEPYPDIWFLRCIIVELVVIFAAIELKCRASETISYLGTLLIGCHLLGWYAWGQGQDIEYRSIEPVLEYAEQITCLLFSSSSIQMIKRHLWN
jgi:hypothetical protein